MPAAEALHSCLPHFHPGPRNRILTREYKAFPAGRGPQQSLTLDPSCSSPLCRLDAEPQGETESRLMKMAEPVALNSWREHKLLYLSWGSCNTDTVDPVTYATEIHYSWFWEIQGEGAGQFSSW